MATDYVQAPPSGLAQIFTVQRLGLLLGIAAATAAVFSMWLWTRTPDYRVLYANLSDRDGGAVVAALQQMNVPYQFAEGGGAILVPAGQVHETRLRLAGQGLPKGGLVGFELMENAKLGTSQFMEQVNYQRALEGELARSIQTLSAVQTARVHLAIAKPSVFVREQPKSSASVILNLRAGRTIEPPQTDAIVHLVSSSVPDLPVSRVTVLDQNGVLLSTTQDPAAVRAGLDASQLKYVQELQAGYARRIESILSPIVGPTNVRAQVSADVDFAQVERAEETYKPNQNPTSAVIRSQQSSESENNGGTQAAGVPGALTNQPPAPATAPVNAPAGAQAAGKAAPAPATQAATPSRESHKDSTVNYEVDRTIQHVRQPVGAIRRISAAVVVNQHRIVGADRKVTFKPLTEDEIAQITALVKEAIGYSQTRGDSLNVVTQPFSEPEQPEAVETPLWKDPEIVELAKTVGRYLLFAIVALYLFFAVLKPMFRTLTTIPPAPAPLPNALPNQGSPPGLGPRSYEANLQAARQVAQQEPRLIANVVKSWMGSNE